MQNLTLDLEALNVESFATSEANAVVDQMLLESPTGATSCDTAPCCC